MYIGDPGYQIRLIRALEMPNFFAYLNDHLSDNGCGEFPLFQPMSRGHSRFPEEKQESFTIGLEIPVGQPNWRRAWIAIDADDSILGHIDLRAYPDLYAEHRAIMGMGVHRDYRRRGLGSKLIETISTWALRETGIVWIDLWVLSGNEPAMRLYQSSEFVKVGEIQDMFRIDGESHAYTLMARRLRPSIMFPTH